MKDHKNQKRKCINGCVCLHFQPSFTLIAMNYNGRIYPNTMTPFKTVSHSGVLWQRCRSKWQPRNHLMTCFSSRVRKNLRRHELHPNPDSQPGISLLRRLMFHGVLCRDIHQWKRQVLYCPHREIFSSYLTHLQCCPYWKHLVTS